MNSEPKQAIVLCGPNSTGKSKVALELARTLDVELVNSDKFHMYSYFQIGTGVSDSFSTSGIPQHLYCVLTPEERLPNVKEYVSIVKSTVTDIISRDRIPLIEGCSFSFNQGIIQQNGMPEHRSVFHPIIGLRWREDEDIRENMRRRLDEMLARGLLQETETALHNGLSETYVMRKGVVYRVIMRYIKGIINLETARQMIVDNAVEIARDQLRRYDMLDGIYWIEHESSRVQETVGKILELTRS